MKEFLRPIKRFVLLLDDQPEYSDGGVIVRKTEGCYHMDFPVVAIGTNEDADFGVGDTVILNSPVIGRRVMLGGTVYRLVRTSDVIGVKEP